MEIRFARQCDYSWLLENDKYVSSKWISRCLKHNEYILAIKKNDITGFIRFSMFWGNIPNMDMIWLIESERGKGTGLALFDFWEREMKKRDAKILLTSSMKDELEPQNWHKRNGFRECGELTFGQYEPTPEVFFIKNLV